MTDNNWISVKEMPKRMYGWFAVAELPRNHSGSKGGCINIESDNEWRKSFGFAKAWLNNGRWYAASIQTQRSVDITPYVTHWAELPSVPEITEPFIFEGGNLYDKPNKQEIMNLAMEQWEKDQKTNPDTVNPHAFSYGFYSALRYLGIA